ncbi:MAG TPA: molybdenum cofactor guanylyltransferase [Candidatus Bathyarchaeota archaeon]|nr:molybdenum cofactor guanylyltransferase [Candidatus Bathyarchaeota archaeon]
MFIGAAIITAIQTRNEARTLLEKAAVILAGGSSKRFGQDKGLVTLAGKPLILHVVEKVSGLVDEHVVVVSSEAQRESFSKLLPENRVVVDSTGKQSPLVGAFSGFQHVSGEYALLLPCDVPFVSRDVVSLLLEICGGRAAVIPRWTNGYIEPLQAVYAVEPAIQAAEEALGEGKLDMRSMIEKLRGVRYVSTLVLRQLDPQLLTFFNVNTPLDLKRAESLIHARGKNRGKSRNIRR